MSQDNDAIKSLIEHWRARRGQFVSVTDPQPYVGEARGEAAGKAHAGATAQVEVINVKVVDQVATTDMALPIQPIGGSPHTGYPDILLQASVVTFGDNTQEGRLVEGVSIAWFEIIKQLDRDPNFLFQINWRKLEEIIAGAYEHAGWPKVELTHRSGDHGRDVIATKPGIGSIRIVDQVKAYSPGHPVTADQVRSILGVLAAEPNISKGVITTSSVFAPGIYKDPGLQAFMPFRLELKDGEALRQWLIDLASRKS